MITKNKDKDVAFVQYILASCCYAVVIIGGYVLLSKAFGRSVELEIIPRAKANVAELSYIEDMRVIFGGDGGKHDEKSGVAELDSGNIVDVFVDSTKEVDSDSVKAATVPVATNPNVPAAVPVAAPTTALGMKKQEAKKSSLGTKRVDENGLESAWLALKNGEFDKVLKICKDIPPNREIQYLKAKAIFGQFKKGEANGKDVMDAWFLVKSRNELGSKWHNEADSILNLFNR